MSQAEPIVVQAVTLTMGTVHIRQRDWLFDLVQRAPEHIKLAISSSSWKPVTNNRNRIMRAFRQCPPEHKFMLMLDEDIIPQGDVLKYVDLDLDIVVFPCPIWQPQSTSSNVIAWNFRKTDENGKAVGQVVANGTHDEISEGGTGAILISRRVAEHPALADPFEEQVDEDGCSTFGHDLAFCRRARAAGFKVWVAYDCMCSHWQPVDLLDVFFQLQQAEARGRNIR